MEYQIIKNLRFGPHRNQDADLILPKYTQKAAPLVLTVHGGSWIGSRKEDYQYFGESLARLGYAVLNVNYRLIPDGADCGDMLDDIGRAVSLVIDDKEKYKLDISRGMAVAGCSSGAHLAMLYAYKGLCPINVKLVFNLVGPSDFLDPSYYDTDNPLFAERAMLASCLAGIDVSRIIPAAPPKELAEISPVHYINEKTPKTVSGYGKLDVLVPFTNAGRLHEKIREKAGKDMSELFVYENSDHTLKHDPETDSAVTARFEDELKRLLPL